MNMRQMVGWVVVVALMVPVVLMGEGGRLGAAAPQDVRIDLSQLSERCTYSAPAPPWEGSGDIEHFGLRARVIVDKPGVVSGHFACTDSPEPGELPCRTRECFLRGEHYITLEMADPSEVSLGCIRYNIKGLRGGVGAVSVDGGPRWFYALNAQDDAVRTVCGLEGGQVLELRLMACPDLNNDQVIDLFGDVMATALVMGQTRDGPEWNHLADHNEDGIVDFFGDIFIVLYRFGLTCADFHY